MGRVYTVWQAGSKTSVEMAARKSSASPTPTSTWLFLNPASLPLHIHAGARCKRPLPAQLQPQEGSRGLVPLKVSGHSSPIYTGGNRGQGGFSNWGHRRWRQESNPQTHT